MITASQCRAARGLLNWTQQRLADAAHIGVATVRLFESEAKGTRQSTLVLLKQAFESAGVEFTNGSQPGVRLTTVVAAHLRAADRATKTVTKKTAKRAQKRR
jgi:transcriptional regulator with XRE-family HTH domain